jgi:hypothetical protein
MKCFNHPDLDAIGICKNCNKGLCKDCLTEVDNGIACTSTCVDEVNQVNSLIQRNKHTHNVASSAHMRNVLLFGGMGIVFLIFGLTTEGIGDFLTIMGILFLLGGILSYTSARKYKSMQ